MPSTTNSGILGYTLRMVLRYVCIVRTFAPVEPIFKGVPGYGGAEVGGVGSDGGTCELSATPRYTAYSLFHVAGPTVRVSKDQTKRKTSNSLGFFNTNIPPQKHKFICRGWNMVEEKNEKKGQEKIILPKETQIEMMKFFLRTSIPRKKKQENSRLSNTNDGSGS